jgi:DNA polymerase-3 subunit delta
MANKPDSQATFQNLMTDLNQNRLLSVYFLCGDEQFFIDRVQDAIIDLVPPEQRDFNLDILYGQDCDVSKILGAAKSYPMMGERRLVLVREFFNAIRPVQGGRENYSLLDPVIHYISNPSEMTTLVLVDSKKPAKTTKFLKAFENSDKAGFFVFDMLDPIQIPAWITDWVKSNFGKKIDYQAAELLYQLTGTSLHQLSTELEKLCTFKKTDEPVTADDVKKIVGFSRQYTVFELKDAVLSKNLRKSMHIAEQMLRSNPADTGEVIRMVAFLYSSFATIWQYQRMVQKGISKSEIDSQLGGSRRTYFIAKEANMFTPAEFPGIFEALLDADRAIKGFSKLDHQAIVIMMLRRIIT